MLSYCLKYRKNTKSKDPEFKKTENWGIMLLAKCAVRGSKKYKFTNEQEASGLLSQLCIRTPWSKIPLWGDILCIKVNNIVNRVLLAEERFMPEIHLRQPGFTYSACWSFTKNKARLQKFKAK